MRHTGLPFLKTLPVRKINLARWSAAQIHQPCPTVYFLSCSTCSSPENISANILFCRVDHTLPLVCGRHCAPAARRQRSWPPGRRAPHFVCMLRENCDYNGDECVVRSLAVSVRGNRSPHLISCTDLTLSAFSPRSPN